MNNICCVCESIVYPGHGSLFIKNDMRSLWFCRSKCKKNFNLNRSPFFLHWTRINRKKSVIILNKKFLLSLLIHKKIDTLKEYDKYLTMHVLYQLDRFKKLEVNRSIDYKYLKNKIKP